MKTHNQRKAGVILSYLNIGIEMLITLAYTPVMLRILGQSEYGIYKAAASVISYLGLLSLGFGSSYMRFYARFRADKDEEGVSRLNGMFMLIFGFAAVMSLLAGGVMTSMPSVVFGDKYSGDQLVTAQVLLAIMTFNMAFSFIGSVYSMYVGAHERFIYQRVLSIIGVIAKHMVALPILLFGFASIGLTLVNTSVNFALFIVNIVYARRLGMRFSFRNPEWRLLREIAAFSFFIFLTSVAGTINKTIDNLLLTRYIGPKAVSVYDIGAMFNSYLMTFSITISGVFIPKINTMVAEENDNTKLTDLMIRIGRIQFFVVMLILGGFTLVGRYFIGIYAGEEYYESYRIALFVMCGSAIPYMQNIGIEIQKAKNRHMFRSVLYFAIAICNIFVSIPLIKSMGISGAAIGTALAVLIGNTIIMNIYYYSGIKLEMGRFWKAMLKPACAAAAAFIPVFVLTRFWPVDRFARFIAVGIGFVALYAAAMWLFGMNKDEKLLFKGLRHRHG